MHRVETLYDWAVEMGVVVERVSPGIDLGVGGMGSSDGAWVTQRRALQIREALIDAGHKLLCSSELGCCIAYRSDDRIGVSIDQDIDEPPPCNVMVRWFDERLAGEQQ